MVVKNSRVEILIGRLCTKINFLQKESHTVAIQLLQESLKLLKHFSVAQQITKLLKKNFAQKTLSRSVKNSCAENSDNLCKACIV